MAAVLVGSGLSAGPASAATALKVNFQNPAATPPSGYVADSGAPYDSGRGYGWLTPNGSGPIDLSGNGRDRGTPADRRLATFMHMQAKVSTTARTGAGRWEAALTNGTYDVTVAVGDGGRNTDGTYCCLDSVHRLTVEGVLAVSGFTPTATTPFQTRTVTVAVQDGRLTIDPAGGTNTKINYVDIAPSTSTPAPTSPQVTGITPAPNATQVPLNTSVNLDVSAPVDAQSVSASSFQLLSPTGQVSGNYNVDAAGGTAAFTPSQNLTGNTLYTVKVTDQLKDTSGRAFAPYTSTFTTGTTPAPLSPHAFTRTASTSLSKPTVLTLGPDGRLYAATYGGQVVRYNRSSSGALSGAETITPFGDRTVLGLAFDPSVSTKLWVAHNDGNYAGAPRFSGRISTLTIAAGRPLSEAVATARDVIIGLPRSAYDHMTNGITFGPDGRLFIAQGGNTAYGAPDPYWGDQGESPLSAGVLVADVHNTSAFPAGATINVTTAPQGTTLDPGSPPAVGYDPSPSTAPVRIFASGVRNPFALAFGTNGALYAPVNESAAGGNAPAGPGGTPPALTNIRAYPDFFTRIESGRYYGHPNPSIGKYALNGGNPTSGGDPYEVVEYPVGTAPDAAWRRPDLVLGEHRSANGVVQYRNANAFGGALQNSMLVTEYSAGDDVIAITLDAAGKAVSAAALPDAASPGQALIFENPLGITSDAASGVVYVSEFGSESDPTAGRITLLTPAQSSTPPVTGTVKVNFQPTGTPPTGYVADTGAPFDGSSGWRDLSGVALDLRSNTRDRNSTAAPDQRYDTFIHMQAPAGSGNTAPGQWLYALPSGQYDVRAVVGDPIAYNSSHSITAEGGTARAVKVIDKLVTSSAAPFGDRTVRVTVDDGFLNLDPTGGTNTKLAFVEITPVGTTDTTDPVVSIQLTGPATGTSTYSGDVTVAVDASDAVGVTSTTLSVDGGPAAPYTGPVTVSTSGAHTVTATAKDAAGNTGTATKSFTIDRTAPPAPTNLHVNFQSETAPVPSGYVRDYGLAFDAARGGGWRNNVDGTPASLVGNGRDRNSTTSADQRYDTFIHMQQASAQYGGVTTPGRWEGALANGTYSVTIAVGDATATDSKHTITAERGTAGPVVLADAFVPTSTNRWLTVTRAVTVTDGYLTLDPTGGTNTKIDFVDAVPVSTSGDTTKPTASISLAGTTSSPGSYTSDVTVTITGQDEAGGSGVASITYTLDGGPATPYTQPFVVTTDGSHTVVATVTDRAGNTGSATKTWTEQHPSSGTPSSKVVTQDDASLGLARPRLVFSSIGSAVTPARTVTVNNTGTAPVTVSSLSITGTHAGSYRLADGQPTSFTVPAGGSANVAVRFTPSFPTNCPTSTDLNKISDVERYAMLTITTNDASFGNPVVDLGGVNLCGPEGGNEPVLAQLARAAGYTTKASNGTSDVRFLGASRFGTSVDEVQTPYFTRADATKPVTLTPIAHYSGRNTATSGYHRTGWYSKGAPVKTPCAAGDGCSQLFLFAPDTGSTYVENQKMMPSVNGTTTFSPSNPFGLWLGDYSDINFTDDAKNIAMTDKQVLISPPHYLHDLRIYQAYGPNRTLIPDTWLVGVDITRVPAYKNLDYQDVLLVLRNARPETGVAAAPGSASLNVDLTRGGTISPTCAVTGFTGVMPNSAGTECKASAMSFGSSGLSITSSAGQMGGPGGAQQNALYSAFDASRTPFTLRTTVQGPINYLTADYQQVAAFFGPDQDNYVKVEAEHAGAGDPKITMFYEEGGAGATVASVAVPGLTSASTLDLVIKGNTSVPDPIPSTSDPNKVRNFPLDEVTVFYSLNGGPLVQVGQVRRPADVMRWFSTSARGGILVSGGGSTTPITATFRSFSIVAG